MCQHISTEFFRWRGLRILAAHLCIGEDGWRDDLVGPKSLSRVHEGGQNLARLPALACACISDVIRQAAARGGFGNSLLKEEGSGLLIEKGISTALCGRVRGEKGRTCEEDGISEGL